jgi:hypothetical protein
VWRRVCEAGRCGRVLVDEYKSPNRIVTGAKKQMAHLAVGESAGFKINRIGFGTGSGPALADDEGLTNAFIKEISGYSFPEDGKVLISVVLETGEANGLAIMEGGLYCEDGTLFARARRETENEETGETEPLPPMVKADDFSIEWEWEITF